MSTRACYTFIDETEEVHVYKHSDGYPTGAAEFIIAALEFAWPLPRFEADEFAAAFVAANKVWWLQAPIATFLRSLKSTKPPKSYGGKVVKLPVEVPYGAFGPNAFPMGGNVRLMQSGSIYDVAPGDIQYRYEIFKDTVNDATLRVRAYATSFHADRRSEKDETLLFECRIEDMVDRAKTWSTQPPAPAPATGDMKAMLQTILQTTDANVTFIKRDGSKRVMRCTLRHEVLPTRSDSTKPKRLRTLGEKSLAVYDLDERDWRMVNVDTLQSVTPLIPA
jgi:hypothetical protein